MSANNSISQLLEQFIELYNNSLSTFEKTNEAITTDKETVAIDLYDPKKGSVKTVQIPSFGFLKREIERLNGNLDALAGTTSTTSNVKLKDGSFSRNKKVLIDGQQRLTTIFIILSYLEDIRQFYDNSKDIYSIDFETRENYRNKDSELYLDNLKSLFGNFYMLSEGGTNTLAILGCEEILTEEDNTFDYICCSVGTGGTISGLINTSLKHQKIIGFSALSGGFLKNDIRKFVTKENWELIEEYTFGGYAKTSNELIAFINSFYNNTKIPLDPVYTGKMMFGIDDLIKKNYFPKGSKILAIHTGGIQGIQGMNNTLKNKKLPLINTYE